MRVDGAAPGDAAMMAKLSPVPLGREAEVGVTVERPPASDGAVVADRAFVFVRTPFLHLPELEAAWFTVCQT